MNRTQIYMIAGVTTISSICIWFIYDGFFSSSQSEETGKEVALRSPIKSEFTISDYLAQKPPKSSQSLDESLENQSSSPAREDTSAIARIQELIRESEKNINNDNTQSLPSSSAKQSLASNLPSDVTPEDMARLQYGIKKKKTRKQTQEYSSFTPTLPSENKTFNSVVLHKDIKRNAIKAYVHSEQTVQEGSTIKMRIAEDCYTDNGIYVRRNSPVYGEVKKIDGERIIVEIKTLNVNGNILPFEKDIYSKDAIPGIWVPGNAKAQVSKDAATGGVDGINSTGLESVGAIGGIGAQIAAQAANGAINAGKQATSKQMKKVKVVVKTNYELYLMKSEKAKQENNN